MVFINYLERDKTVTGARYAFIIGRLKTELQEHARQRPSS